MVSFNLVRKMIEEVRLRWKTPKQAARTMAKCCECGAFNPARAEALLERMRSGASSTPNDKQRLHRFRNRRKIALSQGLTEKSGPIPAFRGKYLQYP